MQAFRSAKEWGARWLGRCFGRGTRAAWNRAYERGAWDFLRSAEERERYRQVAELCTRTCARPTILDVGCGEGILLECLQQMNVAVSAYVGVDLSSEAIRRAQSKHPDVCFQTADAERYIPGSRFDVIVLNESLFYFARPLGVLGLLESGLAGSGVFVVSVYTPPDAPETNTRLWQAVCAHYETVHLRSTVNNEGVRWNMGVFRPKR